MELDISKNCLGTVKAGASRTFNKTVMSEIFLVALGVKLKKCWFQTYARLCMTTKAAKFNKPQNIIEIP